MSIAETVSTYGAIGAFIAAAFLLIGVDRIDPSARGSYFWRVLAAPGVIALWPIVLVRWIQLELRRAR